MGKTIRWGILGTGSIARQFAHGLRFVPGAELIAVASRREVQAKQFAAVFNVPRAYDSYEGLVLAREVDVVYVATPNHLHRSHSLMALEGDKHVLCEKPLACSAAEAEQIATRAREKQLFCMEAMWSRFVPSYAKVRDLLAQRTLGDLKMAHLSLGMPFHFDEEHRVWNPRMGGGALLDLGVYPLSFCVGLWGEPQSIQSEIVRGVTGVDEEATAILRYESGLLATVSTSIRHALPNNALLMGTLGSLEMQAPLYCSVRLHGVRYELGAHRASEEIRPVPRLSHHPVLRPVYLGLKARAQAFMREKTHACSIVGNGYNYEAEEVMRCLRAGELQSAIMPLSDSIKTLRLVDAIASGAPSRVSS